MNLNFQNIINYLKNANIEELQQINVIISEKINKPNISKGLLIVTITIILHSIFAIFLYPKGYIDINMGDVNTILYVSIAICFVGIDFSFKMLTSFQMPKGYCIDIPSWKYLIINIELTVLLALMAIFEYFSKDISYNLTNAYMTTIILWIVYAAGFKKINMVAKNYGKENKNDI